MNKAEKLTAIMAKPKRRIIGLMSGMSMDGVDLAYAEISGEFPSLEVRLLASHYHPYSPPFQARLLAGRCAKISEASELNVLVAEEFALTVKEFLCKHQLSAASIDAIGSHGQTLFHSTSSGENTPSSLQVGSPSIIAELTGITTVGNFRVRDIAAGGQGAPLVSLADHILFHNPAEIIALNNLGSISNVTIVTPNPSEMLSFDTGPANMAIDFFARQVPGNSEGMDLAGSISATGHCIPDLLAALLTNQFFQKKPPKAAGYEEFSPRILEEAIRALPRAQPQDLTRTAVEWSAVTIAMAYREFVLPKFPKLTKVIFSGGGVYNQTLMSRIVALLPMLKIETLPNTLADAKEALAFAVLANELLSGRPGSLPCITGVKAPTVLGEIAL